MAKKESLLDGEGGLVILRTTAGTIVGRVAGRTNFGVLLEDAAQVSGNVEQMIGDVDKLGQVELLPSPIEVNDDLIVSAANWPHGGDRLPGRRAE